MKRLYLNNLKKMTVWDVHIEKGNFSEAVVQRCSVKNVFLEISQNS